MDYSKFVAAVLKDDRKELNEITPIISRVLIKFLIVRMNASPEDAEDSSQNTLLLAINKIKNDKLDNPDVIIYYLFTAAKNDYLKQHHKNNKTSSLNPSTTHVMDAQQLENLLEKERYTVLKRCLEELDKESHHYINFWFENPDMDSTNVADHFNISLNNAWTKKHRIIQTLKRCFQKKIHL